MSNSQILVPDDFPQGMKSKELKVVVVGYLHKVRESGSQENVVIQCYPLIALGLNELQSRENKFVTRVSILIGVVSLIVAAVALEISITNARSSDESSARQIELLEGLNTNSLESQNVAKQALAKLQTATPKQEAGNTAVKRDAPKTARPLP